MKKQLCKVVSLIVIFCLISSASVLSVKAYNVTDISGDLDDNIYISPSAEENFADSRVIVVMSNEASLELNDYTTEDFPEVECKEVKDFSSSKKEKARNQLEKINYAFHNQTSLESENIVSFKNYNQIICIELQNIGKENVLNAINLLQKREDVLYVEPDYFVQGFVYPNDSSFASQHRYVTKMDIDQAWEITTGSSDVLVGVVDSGIYAGQVINNELVGGHYDFTNRVDRDLSVNYVTEELSENGITEPASPLSDPAGHGTHVAGIIGAEGNNQTAVTGICWNVTLVSLRVLNSNRKGYSSYVYQAIDYADSIGIDILNMSLGWPTYDSAEYAYHNTVLYSIIENFDGLVVCAAGNDDNDNDDNAVYPANYNNLPNLISVGACDWYDEKADFSNYGKNTVDLFATGVNIWNTYIRNNSDCYYKSGTSMAAPMVSGVAALLLSIHPELTAAELKQIIMSSVDEISALENYCVTGGRLNAYKALTNSLVHTFVNRSTGTTSHNTICSGCGYVASSEDHSFVCEMVEGEHTVICSGCDYKQSGAVTYVNKSISTGHTATCSRCDYSSVESHEWWNLKGTYNCARCGAKSTIVPGSGTLSVEILDMIQAKGLTGDFAMSIDEDTVLCCLNGEYYYVKGQTEANALQYLEAELASLTVVKPEVQTE